MATYAYYYLVYLFKIKVKRLLNNVGSMHGFCFTDTCRDDTALHIDA